MNTEKLFKLDNCISTLYNELKKVQSQIELLLFKDKKANAEKISDLINERDALYSKIDSYKKSRDKCLQKVICLNNEEKELVKNSLNYFGDYLADHTGYSSGIAYWDLIKKFD